MEKVVQFLFRKALSHHPSHIDISAKLCYEFRQKSCLSAESNSTTFTHILWRTVKDSYEGFTDEKYTDAALEAMDNDARERVLAARRQFVGINDFIGELFNVGILNQRKILTCIQRLLDRANANEVALDALCSLIERTRVTMKLSDSNCFEPFLGPLLQLADDENFSNQKRSRVRDVLNQIR